ncbi:MAG: hypothetical protein ACI9LI_000860 [Saprospiraceae bacterium]|jgi:hypothetical protein
MTFRPWGIVKKAIIWTSAGFIDRINQKRGCANIKVGKMIAQKFDNCQPWTDHLTPTAINNINVAMKANDFNSARGLVAFGTTAVANKDCIEMLEFAIDLLADGKELLINLYFLE